MSVECQSCTEIGQGQYQLETGQSSCKKCPEGHVCTAPDQPPMLCLPGKYAKGITSCALCAEGRYQINNGTTECHDCPTGYSCLRSNKLPEACAKGSYSSIKNSITCLSCESGQYQINTNSTSCLPCPKGSMCQMSTEIPVKCEAGKYAERENSITCTSCSSRGEGHYQLEMGKSSCKKCPTGYVCSGPDQEPMILIMPCSLHHAAMEGGFTPM